MASGMARGASARGKRVAFGDKELRKIRWDHNSEEVLRYNPNVALPGEEDRRDLEWIRYYKGHRIYNVQASRSKWGWQRSFRVTPGEMYFTDEELRAAESVGEDFVLIEPNVPNWKSVAPNKQWSPTRYAAIADELSARGLEVVQLEFGEKFRLTSARKVKTSSFREASAILHRAKLFVGPEGGMHHSAAADAKTVDGVLVQGYVPAVVIFGGFIPPEITGYSFHENVAVGEACGQFVPCAHCAEAMDQITVEEVLSRIDKTLLGEKERKWTAITTGFSAA